MPGREAELEEKQREVNYLRNNVKMERMKLSKTIQDIINHCYQHAQSDPLLHPVKDNPFREKKSCHII